MHLAKYLSQRQSGVGVVEDEIIRPLTLAAGQYTTLTEILEADDPADAVRFMIDDAAEALAALRRHAAAADRRPRSLGRRRHLRRSKTARMEESVSSATVLRLGLQGRSPGALLQVDRRESRRHDKPVPFRKDSHQAKRPSRSWSSIAAATSSATPSATT